MRIQQPLATVTPTLDGSILAVLARADAAFTVGDLHRMIAGRSAEGIRKTITRLVNEGVVVDAQTGRTHSYQLNRNHLAAPAIVMLASLDDLLVERIRQSISEWDEQPVFGALFGSAARGEMRLDSDIDLFLVHLDDSDHDRFQAQIDKLSGDITQWTGNDARILSYGESEILGTAAADPILRSVADEGKPVAGDPARFRRAIRGAQRR